MVTGKCEGCNPDHKRNQTIAVLKFVLRKLAYGLLVLIGVMVLVFVLFQGFGDPARLVMGQSGDAATQANILLEM